MAYMWTFSVYWVNKTRGSRRNGMWRSLGRWWLAQVSMLVKVGLLVSR